VDQPLPHTTASLTADLRSLGVAPGDVVLLHSSMRSLGFVAGGVHAAVEALLAAVDGGTLVVPTHTSDNSDPAEWSRPPVPESWWPVIREHTPAFDPARTPSRSMGAIAEAVRCWPGAARSDHPQVSFAAVGPRAADVVAEHPLDDPLGERSPLAAVYRLDGKVLLLGCGYDRCTSLHLAECRQPAPPRHRVGAAVRWPDGSAGWTTWTEVVADESDFDRLGADFEGSADAGGELAVGRVGEATARLVRQRSLVDFGVRWLARHRG
jgi:aminoglycoside 3-N-acetyltransferase